MLKYHPLIKQKFKITKEDKKTNLIMLNANGIHNGGFVYIGRSKALQILVVPKQK